MQIVTTVFELRCEVRRSRDAVPELKELLTTLNDQLEGLGLARGVEMRVYRICVAKNFILHFSPTYHQLGRLSRPLTHPLGPQPFPQPKPTSSHHGLHHEPCFSMSPAQGVPHLTLPIRHGSNMDQHIAHRGCMALLRYRLHDIQAGPPMSLPLRDSHPCTNPMWVCWPRPTASAEGKSTSSS